MNRIRILSRPLALVGGGLLVLGCVDEANPVIPSTGASDPSGISTTSADGGLPKPDSALVLDGPGFRRDGGASDALGQLCDLREQLKPNPQACPGLLACFPQENVFRVDGIGRCLFHDEIGAGGNCSIRPVGDPTRIPCAPGFACVSLQGIRGMGYCRTLCDVARPVQCGLGSPCIPLPSPPTATDPNPVGYCQLG